MGHLRLGRLPKTQPWRQVVRLIDEAPTGTPAVASATARAAEARLRELARDPSLVYCFWLLTRIASASRGPDFERELAELGLSPAGTESALGFIGNVADRVGAELVRYPGSGPFAELAALALRRSLTETVGQEGRSLFGSSLEDLRHAFRRHSSDRQFGVLAKTFFGDFLARTLRFFVEKELSNHVGTGHALTRIDASREFAAALDLHARQSARIVEDFAAGWYGKERWEARGTISRDDAARFVAVAVRKLRAELTQAEAAP
jgi:hypothetical protein